VKKVKDKVKKVVHEDSFTASRFFRAGSQLLALPDHRP